jgi:hypothetical protein
MHHDLAHIGSVALDKFEDACATLFAGWVIKNAGAALEYFKKIWGMSTSLSKKIRSLSTIFEGAVFSTNFDVLSGPLPSYS